MNKEFLIILFGRLAIAIIGLVSLRLITHYLEPEQYGELALLTSIQAFCSLILVNPVGQFINVNTHKWNDDETLLGRMSSYQGYLTIVGLIGSIAVLISMFNTSTNIVLAMIVVAITIFATNWNSTLVPLLNMLGHRKASILWGLATIILGTTFSTLLVILVSPSAISWLVGQGLGMLAGAFGAKFYLYKYTKNASSYSRVSWINRHNLYAFCAPLIVATFLMWLSQSGYRFLIEYYWGLEQLAFFAVGFTVAGAIWAVVEAIASQFLYPYFYRGAGHENARQVQLVYSDLVNVLIPVYILIAGAMYVSAPYLLKVLVDAQYQSALFFLMAGVLVEALRLSTGVFSLAAHVTHNTNKLTLPYALGALLITVLVVASGLNKADLILVAYVLIGAGMATLFLMVYRMHLLLRIQINWQAWSIAVLVCVLMIQFVKVEGSVSWFNTFVYLSSIGLVTGLLIFLLLRRNPSFLRLTSISIN